MNNRRFLRGMLLLLWALILAPLGTSRAADRPTVSVSGKAPAKNDTLVVWYPNDPDTINPITANDTVSDEWFRLCYEYLAPRKFSEPDTFEPKLAESWQFDKDKLEYTIHLRKGVKWQPMKLPNGKDLPETEFTAADVKFTFDCVLNKNIEAGHYRSYYEDPEAKDEAHRYKIKVSLVPGDKYTLKVKWSQPYFLMDDYTLFAFPIIPKHVYSVNEKGEPISFDISSKEFAEGFNNHWANTKACGTGPMILKQWKKDQQAEFVRNPNYWGAPMYFSNCIYRCITNANTEVQQILQNELDFGVIAEKDLFMQSKKNPNVVSGKVELAEFLFPGYRYMGYNMNREFFKDSKVRWAIGHAVPVKEIIDKVYYGMAVPINGPFMPGSAYNDKSLPLVDYDLDKARKLLDDAGWVDSDGDGIRDKKIAGQKVDAKFDLMIYADTQSYLTIAEAVKENCRKIGVEVIISPTKWGLMLQKLQKKEFDATILGWALSWIDDPYQIFHGSQADVPNTSNHVGYKNPETDKLIEKLRVTLDKDEQIKLYHQIHKQIYDDQPYTFLFADKHTAGYDHRLDNLKFYPLRPCFDAWEWGASTARVLGQ